VLLLDDAKAQLVVEMSQDRHASGLTVMRPLRHDFAVPDRDGAKRPASLAGHIV
jgi:hypothetical protein